MTSTNTPYNNSSNCLDYKTNEKEVLRLNDEYSHIYRLLEGTKAESERLKTEKRSGSQNKKKVLGQVGGPRSNTTLRASDPLK